MGEDGDFFPVSKWPRQYSNSCFSDSKTSDLLNCSKKLTESASHSSLVRQQV